MFRPTATILAAAALALSSASLAHAEPVSSGGGSGQHESCEQGNQEYPDGYTSRWKDTNGNRGSVTCTNGTLCTSTGWKNQTTGQMSWTYSCTDSDGRAVRASGAVVKASTKSGARLAARG